MVGRCETARPFGCTGAAERGVEERWLSRSRLGRFTPLRPREPKASPESKFFAGVRYIRHP